MKIETVVFQMPLSCLLRRDFSDFMLVVLGEDPVGEDCEAAFVCCLLGVLTLMLGPNSCEFIQ